MTPTARRLVTRVSQRSMKWRAASPKMRRMAATRKKRGAARQEARCYEGPEIEARRARRYRYQLIGDRRHTLDENEIDPVAGEFLLEGLEGVLHVIDTDQRLRQLVEDRIADVIAQRAAGDAAYGANEGVAPEPARAGEAHRHQQGRPVESGRNSPRRRRRPPKTRALGGVQPALLAGRRRFSALRRIYP